MSDHHNTKQSGYTQSEPHPSGLIRAVLETGRTRGSSATPVPALEVVSPSPQRPLQPYIDNMDNATRSFNGSTGARSDRNSQQVSPASSARSARSGQSIHSHPQSHKSINTQVSGQYQGQNQNRGQAENSPHTSVRSSGQNTGQVQDGPSQAQNSGQSQTPPQGNNHGQPENQFQGHNSGQAQGQAQFQNSVIPAWQIAGAAMYQLAAQNQLQSQAQSQGHSQSQGQDQIHPQGQFQVQHRRQISSSRMNPAVPPFQSSFQSTLQTFQPLQPIMFSTQVSQPVNQMMVDSQEHHALMNDLIQNIKGIDAMSSALKERLIENTENIRRSYDRKFQHMKQDVEKLCFEQQTNQRYLDNTTMNLRQAYLERDRLGAERDALLEAKNKSEAKAVEASRQLNELEKHWKKVTGDVKKNLAESRAEIERLRALLEKANLELDHNRARDVKFLDAAHVRWMFDNPPSSVRSRRDTETSQDPFASPSVASSATFPVSGMGAGGLGSPPNTSVGLIGHGFGQSSAFGHIQPNSGPPNATAEQMFPDLHKPRRRLNLPTKPPTRGRTDIPNSPWDTESSRAYNTEPGDTPIAASRSTALVLSSVGAEDPSLFYQEQFAGLYQLIEGWAMAYCTRPKISNDQTIARTNQKLWAFMMNCTYPGQRQDAHSHVTLLLNDAKSRPWFVVRMGVEYVVEEMLSLKSYKNFSAKVGAELAAVKAQLLERGLANDARQALTDRRAKAIQSAVGSPQWENYRSGQLSNHSKQLRDILGPMLDDSADRSKAGKDLGFIALKAWDISEHMNTAQVTFQVYFPETAGKFTAATMISRDITDTSPMSLQLNQTRVKLVITPVITMRDDRGTTIKAKNLHFSTVLTMK
ncbi:hypothetical protein BKA65DRAFT_478708 [Rhexocercosporidium sp. MPI-PUGE-AT-0058]|nr:hypothetical protein BKA65DRAFT_478708 [Rhexocercosporidium sp. MPI-PUGE-AT-0058]